MHGKAATTLKDLEARLLASREDLVALARSSAADRKPVELDQTSVGRLSRMDALQRQAMALETERRRQVELTRIEAALRRMADGDYGYCLTCDEEIPIDRLVHDPAAPLCVECARAG